MALLDSSWFVSLEGLRILLGLGPGLAMLAWAFRNYLKDTSTNNWPTMEGTITSARHISGSKGMGFLEITYSYNVQGQSYKSKRISFGNPYFCCDVFRSLYKRLLKECRVGDKVRIYVDPHNSKVSVLITGATGGNWLQVVIGIIFLTLGVLVVLR